MLRNRSCLSWFFLLSFSLQPPNGTAQGANTSNEKKAKVQEQLRTIKILFKRLRLIYEKCNENCQGMEYTHIEVFLLIIWNSSEQCKTCQISKYGRRDKFMNEKLKVLIPYLSNCKMTLNIQHPPLLHQSGKFMKKKLEYSSELFFLYFIKYMVVYCMSENVLDWNFRS